MNENESIAITFDRYAIIQTGGKQYQALEGKTIAIEKLEAKVGDKITFDEVLLRRSNASTVEVGRPYLDAPVKAEVIKHGKGEKVIIFKFKRRHMSRVKRGHRQPFTVVRITAI
jgi:large subunit ribosomal protein L21